MVGNERGETETVQMELKSLSTLSLEKDFFVVVVVDRVGTITKVCGLGKGRLGSGDGEGEPGQDRIPLKGDLPGGAR